MRSVGRINRYKRTAGLEISFIIDRFEALLQQRLDNAIQVGLRIGEEGGVFVVVRINNEGLGRWNEPEINRVAQCRLEQRLNCRDNLHGSAMAEAPVVRANGHYQAVAQVGNVGAKA